MSLSTGHSGDEDDRDCDSPHECAYCGHVDQPSLTRDNHETILHIGRKLAAKLKEIKLCGCGDKFCKHCIRDKENQYVIKAWEEWVK